MKLHEIEFITQLARIAPTARPAQIERLLKLAQQYQSLAVAECNYELTKRQQTRQANIELEIQMTIAGWGVKYSVGGDPRGHTVKLIHPDFTGGWERGILGVPTK